MGRNKKIMEPPKLKLSLQSFVAGFLIYWIVASTRNMWSYHRSSKAGVALIAIMFVVSLILVIGSTISIALRVRADVKEDRSTEDRLIGSLAAGSLIATTITLFIPLFSTASLVMGVIAIQRSSSEKSHPKIKTYRNMSLVAIVTTAVNIFWTIMVARA